MASDAQVRMIVRAKLLDSIEDLRKQAEEGEIHALAYVAVHESGTNVVTALTNGVLRPVTLLGALTVLGALRNDSDSGNALPLEGASIVESASAGGVAHVRLNLS